MVSTKNTRIALVGSPNSGKTTLFNTLTGSRQKTGNYAGVTVEKKEGTVHLSGTEGNDFSFTLLDLPGAYSLDARTPDEAITADVVTGRRDDERAPDAVIAVADSTNLERNLYLVLQLRETGVPMVVALTMSDLARKRGIEISKHELESRLGVPVIFTSAVRGEGLDTLVNNVQSLVSTLKLDEKAPHASVINTSDRILARYKTIEETIRASISKKTEERDTTAMIDRIALHRLLGPVILALFFGAMFQAVFSLAHLPMDAIQSGAGALQAWLDRAITNDLLRSLLADGIVAGVGTVVTFLPQILLLFAFILFFEDSGYMARAAFIMDRLMGRVGLHGRSFIPLLSSFACAVPGIMATRTIESRRDRFITILVSPLMTCSARIPIYTLLIAVFVPATSVFGVFNAQGLAMMGLYLFGIVMALSIAALLRKTAFRGENESFVMELPTYKIPSLKNVALGLLERTRIFLQRAGTIILSVAVVLWILMTFPRVPVPTGMPESQTGSWRIEHSIAGHAGKLIEPVIKPLGYDWKIGVGLLSSFAAREVILSTLGTVYAIDTGAAGDQDARQNALTTKIKADPAFSLATGLSLLIFYALACQCMSTLAVVRRETNSWRWPAAMFGYMTVLAYGGAFLTYRIALFFIG